MSNKLTSQKYRGQCKEAINAVTQSSLFNKVVQDPKDGQLLHFSLQPCKICFMQLIDNATCRVLE
jgi:hypothetical protein